MLILTKSGSGKSALIKAAMGLLGSDGLVTRGDIRYMDQNILDIPEKEKRKIRGAGIGMIFQDAGAFPTAGFSHKAKYLSMFKGEAP